MTISNYPIEPAPLCENLCILYVHYGKSSSEDKDRAIIQHVLPLMGIYEIYK